MKTMLIALAAFAATAAAKNHAETFYLNVDVCPGQGEQEVMFNEAPTKVCMATTTLEDNQCKKKYGDTVHACYIPACFNNGNAPPANVIPCPAAGVAGTSIGSGQSLMPTTMTTSFSTRFLSNLPNNNGLKSGWPDVPKSAFLNYPESLVGRVGQIPNVYIGKDFKMVFKCSIAGDGNLCDVFAFIYRCPPCTFSDGGNFALALLADDWEPYNCDVKFMLDQTVPTHQHDVLVYHKQTPHWKSIPQNDIITISPTEVLELSWYAMGPATANCKDYNEAECATELPKECKWDSETDTCHRVLCPAKSQGPDHTHNPGPGQPHKDKGPVIQKCKVCVEEERAVYMPTLL